MASGSWEDFYHEVESGSIVAIPEGSYEVTVDAVRMASKGDVQSLFLDLTLLSGANAGKTTQASLHVSQASSKLTDLAAELVGETVTVNLSADGDAVLEERLAIEEING